MSLLENKVIDFTKEPMFFGSGRNIARLDLNIGQWVQKRTDKALSLTWFKHDFSYHQDAKDFDGLDTNLQELFLVNLKFQTMLDSLATRTVLEVFKPCTTMPQLESWWTVHGFQEDIHSQSYAELIKALPVNASKIFDDIMINPNILERASSIVDCFDDTVVWNARKVLGVDYDIELHKKSMIKSLYALNILEAGLFQTSFITTFAFAENGLMESAGKTMSKIALDEVNHKAMTQFLINDLKKDKDWKYLFVELEDDIRSLYKDALDADYLWIDYCFRDGARLLGLNAPVLKQYANHNMWNAMTAIGEKPVCDRVLVHPCSWAIKYVNTGKLQVALNESDGINYLLGALDKDVKHDSWQEFKI